MENLKTTKEEKKSDLSKYLIIGIIGFGLSGILWGIGLFYETFTITAEPRFHLPNTKIYDPFSYLPAILFLTLGGSLLAVLFKNKKRMFRRLVLFGLIGSVVGVWGGLFVSYPLLLWSPVLIMQNNAIFALTPSLLIGQAVLVFALIGFIIGAFYAFALKIKILFLAKYGAIGFALGSLIGPVIGNGILNLSGSLFLTYLITFFIICAFLGAFLGLGIYRNMEMNKEKS